MVLDFRLPARATAHRALLCLLLLAVLLHGQAGVLRQLLGAAHWHVPAAKAAAPAAAPSTVTHAATWLDQALAWRQQLQARSPLVGGHAMPGHHHDGSERHHHGPQDSSVVALESGNDTADTLADTLAGSLLQPLALAAGLCWAAAAALRMHWSPAGASAWRDAGTRLPERPPRG